VASQFLPSRRSRWAICTNKQTDDHQVCGSQVDLSWWNYGHGRRCFPRQIRDWGAEAAFERYYVPENEYAWARNE
jgi:hypothetical protein